MWYLFSVGVEISCPVYQSNLFGIVTTLSVNGVDQICENQMNELIFTPTKQSVIKRIVWLDLGEFNKTVEKITFCLTPEI